MRIWQDFDWRHAVFVVLLAAFANFAYNEYQSGAFQKQHEIALLSRHVVTPNGIIEAAVIINTDGKIVDVINVTQVPSRMTALDFGGLYLLPGLVDVHTHINEPGRTEWEGFITATKAAAAGGITTLVDMPINSHPAITNLTRLENKIKAAEGKLWVDVGFFAGLTQGNAGELEDMIKGRVLAIKAFMVHSGMDDFPEATEDDLRAALPIIAKYGVPLHLHAELKKPDHVSPPVANPRSYKEYLDSRPRSFESDAIELVIRLAKEFNGSKAQPQLHIVHLSNADAVPMLQEARDAGLALTVETCPHYLFFSAEEIPDGRTVFKCAPPIREEENRKRLWDALKAGVIDVIASDHSPCPPELKLLDQGDFMKAWGGISSLQLGLPVTWTKARHLGISMEHVVRWMATNPAKLVGLEGRKGALAKGYDADIVVFDPEARLVIGGEESESEEFAGDTTDAGTDDLGPGSESKSESGPGLVEGMRLHHRHKVTPYTGRRVFGKVLRTFVRGVQVYGDERFDQTAFGEVLLSENPLVQ